MVSDESIPGLPAWVDQFAGLGTRGGNEANGIRFRRGSFGTVLSVSVREAALLDADELEARVEGAYTAIAAAFGAESSSGGSADGLFPIRFWNFIPGIHAPMGRVSEFKGGEGAPISRYMVFNAGRFKAIERWRSLGAARGSVFGGGIAAATGVGYRGSDLAIHCLAAGRPGRAVENPRQVPAYRYSRKFGPLPPCFARGTVASGPSGRVLLVGGTASVRGEESVHGDVEPGGKGSLVAQVRETLENLKSLIETGLGPASGEAALHSLRDLRVYHTRPDDASEILSALRTAIAPEARVEFVRADICRPELLVEIEGVAGGGSPAAD